MVSNPLISKALPAVILWGWLLAKDAELRQSLVARATRWFSLITSLSLLAGLLLLPDIGTHKTGAFLKKFRH
jgi:hypothetical protein